MAVTVESIDVTIAEIQSGGQSISQDGMQYTAASLPGLIKLREQVARQAGRAGGGRPLFRRFNMGGAGA